VHAIRIASSLLKSQPDSARSYTAGDGLLTKNISNSPRKGKNEVLDQRINCSILDNLLPDLVRCSTAQLLSPSLSYEYLHRKEL
jgi:hypothetical protein